MVSTHDGIVLRHSKRKVCGGLCVECVYVCASLSGSGLSKDQPVNMQGGDFWGCLCYAGVDIDARNACVVQKDYFLSFFIRSKQEREKDRLGRHTRSNKNEAQKKNRKTATSAVETHPPPLARRQLQKKGERIERRGAGGKREGRNGALEEKTGRGVDL